MWTFVKNLLLLLGVLSIIYTAMNLWDRFHQDAKPNIERFITSVDFPDQAGDSRDARIEALTTFLNRNEGRRVYIELDFLFTGSTRDRSTLKPARLPSPNETAVLHFIGNCDIQCNVELDITPTHEVEQQLFNPTPVLWRLRGYFLDVDFGGRGSASWATLKPISADSILS